MNPLPQDPGRKSLPHLAPKEFQNQSIIQFISCNVARRRPLLTNAAVHSLLLCAWKKADHWLIGRYVIMPDPIHLFCAPRCVPVTPLKRWMEFWRADVTRNWPNTGDKPIWQKDFFDRQLRSSESYRQKWIYELENPVKAGLANCWEDWPYQGELNVLSWHDPT